MQRERETTQFDEDASSRLHQRIVSCIVASLKADPRRDIYEARYPKNEFWITYQGGGPFAGSIVKSMALDGLLVRKYQNCECYTLAANGELSGVASTENNQSKAK